MVDHIESDSKTATDFAARSESDINEYILAFKELRSVSGDAMSKNVSAFKL